MYAKRRCSCPDVEHVFDPRAQYSTWRKLWLYLAQSQKEMGMDLITDEAIEEMKEHLSLTDDDLAETMSIDSTDIKEVSVTCSDIRSLANTY
jgi:adenylosuccinate lyase